MAAPSVDQTSEVEVCPVDELWEGELVEVQLPCGRSAIVVNVEGCIYAYDNACPHAASRLSDGDFEGNVITCGSHMWEFSATTGEGINPSGSQLVSLAVTTRDDVIYVVDETQKGNV